MDKSPYIALPRETKYTCPNCGNAWQTTYDWQNINKCVKCGEIAKAEKLPQTYNVWD